MKSRGLKFLIAICIACIVAVLLYMGWVHVPGARMVHVWNAELEMHPTSIISADDENIIVAGRKGAYLKLHDYRGGDELYRDIFINRLSRSGEILGSVTSGSNNRDFLTASALSPQGDIFIAGWFEGRLPDELIDEVEVPSVATFLCKYNNMLELEWIRTWGRNRDITISTININETGEITVIGDFFGAVVDLDPSPDSTFSDVQGTNGIFFLSMSSDGGFISASTIACSGEGHCYATDAQGRTYAFGLLCEEFTYGSGESLTVVESNGDFDVYLMCIAEDHEIEWVKIWGSEGLEFPYDMSIDSQGGIYVCGFFSKIVDFDPGEEVLSVDAYARQDAFISKFDPNGNHVWTATWGGVMNDSAVAVACVDDEYVYCTGKITGPGADFDTSSDAGYRRIYSECNGYVVCYDIDGQFQWAETWGGVKAGTGHDICVDSTGQVWCLGSIDAFGTKDFLCRFPGDMVE